MDRALISKREVARLQGVCLKTVGRREQDEGLGFPRGFMIKGRRYFCQDEVLAWIEKQKENSLQAA